MKRISPRATTTIACACLMAALVAVPSAQAAVTASNITTPKDLTYFVYNADNPNTFAVTGTSNGTTGDNVDVDCYDGDAITPVASNVAVNANGSFSAPASLAEAARFRVCHLRAVPAGTTPSPSGFTGPRVMTGYKQSYAISSGPNSGKPYDYYLFFQQLEGGNDYLSLGSCGLDEGYLLDPSDSLSSRTWYCNAALFNGNANGGSSTRSEVQVDGADAYTPDGAYVINNAAASGFPALTWSYHLNPRTGDATIHESDQLVKCPVATYPPTAVSCPTFSPTGVTDTRTIVQNNKGLVTWITDVFKSTDGKKHTLNLLWDNEQRFHNSGDSTQLEYRFPGHSSYSMHALNDSVSLPAKPGTVFVRMHGAADGDTNSGRGAIVYDRPASAAKFVSVSSTYERFTLHQNATVPAHGSVRVRFAYIDSFHQAVVTALAKQATTVFAGCTVPKLAGKTLAAAKKAIVKAHCTVGRITNAHSTTVAKGDVISSKPKAGSKVDYGAKVALVVSKG